MTETNFKHTDLGLIPHDWEVKELESLCSKLCVGFVGTCEPYYTSVYNGVRMLRTGDIKESYVDLSNTKYVTLDFHINHVKSQLKKGDILIARHGSNGHGVLYESDDEANSLNFVILRTETVSSKYLIYLLDSSLLRTQIEGATAGSTQKVINTKEIAKLQTPLPPTLAEQERIAGALSSIDTLIGALTEQIEKKRHIKQGAMQQLLTGKKRLAGFTGEWKSVKLSEICDFAKGKGLKKEYLTDSGQYRCILYGEIFTKYDGIIKSVVSRTDVYEGTLSKKGDVLMPGSTTTIGIDLVKAVALNEDNILLGGDVIILRPKEKQACADFLAYLISNVDRNKVADVTQGITIIHLHAKNMVDIMYTIPPTIAEQSAIAAVLSRMDTEIAALEQKRDKYIAIKSGMMQNLLTGKIRLV